jgi:hypothetical protein
MNVLNHDAISKHCQLNKVTLLHDVEEMHLKGDLIRQETCACGLILMMS